MPAIVISGASTGIGAATALHLARQGHRVFAGVRKVSDGERLQDEAPAVDRHRIVPLMLDVTDHDSVVAAEQTVRAALGTTRLAAVINNAGIAVRGPVEYLPLDAWERVFAVNVFGAVDLTRVFLPLLRGSHGRVLFIGSLSGRVSMPMLAPYAASKHAISATALALRGELAPWGLPVSVIEPGPVKTPIWTKSLSCLAELGLDEPGLDEPGAAGSSELAERYGPRLRKASEGDARSARTGVEPAAVVKVIDRALNDERPKARYLVGARGWAVGLFARIAPDRLLDVLARSL